MEINSGAAGLAAALVLGPRIGFGREPMKPHNLTLVMLGAGLLWFGWFGFNAGSALAANNTAAVVFVNTLLAGCTGMLSWLLVERLRDGHATSFGGASGVVAGWSRSPPPASPSRRSARWSSACWPAASARSPSGLKYHWGYDDSLDVVGVHLVGGLVGMFAIGLLASAASPAGVDGLLYGGGPTSWAPAGRDGGDLRLLLRGLGRSWSGCCTARMGFRVEEEHETSGVDLVIHAETAYDLHETSGARPHFGGGGIA